MVSCTKSSASAWFRSEALLEAVYRTEVENLAEAERKFAQTMPPVEALRTWMLLFIDYIAAKQIIASALNTLVYGTSKLFDASGAQIKGAIHALVRREVESATYAPISSFSICFGLLSVSPMSPASRIGLKSARRLVDILILGSRSIR